MWRTRLTDEELQNVFAEQFADLDTLSYWMVIWIGKLSTKADGNVLVEVVIVRIAEKVLTTSVISRLDFQEIRTISVHALLIPLIRPGTIFNGARIQLDKHYQYLSPRSVVIDNTNCTSQRIEDWKFGEVFRRKLGFHNINIPDSKKRKQFCKESKIWVLKNVDHNLDAELIIYPSNEIARFYLFRSSRIAEGIINPHLDPKKKNRLFVPGSPILPAPDTPWHQFFIRDEMHATDAHVIARIAFSPEARKAANLVYLSFKNRDDTGLARFYLDTCFPFEGKALQEVYGFTIVIEAIKVFLVLEISECYSRFPFNSLRFDWETPESVIDKSLPPLPGTRYDPENKNPGKPVGTPPKIIYNYDPKFDDDVTFNSEIKNDPKFNKARYVEKKIRFPSLTKDIKRISRSKPVPPKIDPANRNVLPASNISTNESKENGTNSAGVEIISAEMDCYPGNYADLLKLIVIYFKKIACSIKYYNLVDKDGQEEFCYITFDVSESEPHPKQRAFADVLNGRRRRCVAIDVKYEGKHFLIFELEPQGNTSCKVFAKEDKYNRFTDDDVKFIINESIKDVEEWKRLNHIKLYKIYHKKTSPKDHAIHILQRIDFLKEK